MQPLDKSFASSADVCSHNMDKLREIFPACFLEASGDRGQRFRIDFDALKEALGAYVEDCEERYGFTWAGKAKSRRAAQSPSTGTLRPRLSESLCWEATKNVFVEGEALEVLKLLQKPYHRAIKLVFIDPPYNKGGETFFPGGHLDELDTYLRAFGGSAEERVQLAPNSTTSGEYHARWMCMMYPRLMLARNLLAEDGFCVVCIDDNEIHHLRMLMDGLYGEENQLATIAVERARKNDAHFFSVGHEYLLVYAKSKSHLRANGVRLRMPKPGVEELKSHYAELRRQFKDDWKKIKKAVAEYVAELKQVDPRAAKAIGRYKNFDEGGPYRKDGDSSWHGGGGPRYEVLHPTTGRPCKIPKRGWAWPTYEAMKEQIDAGNIVFGKDETTIPTPKNRLFDSDEQLMASISSSYAQTAAQDLEQLFGGTPVYEHPKDPNYLLTLIEYLTDPGDIVLDLYARIGSVPHAVILSNTSPGSVRRFICVQPPEPFDPTAPAGRNAEKYCRRKHLPANLAALARERIRLAAESCSSGSEISADKGFRCFQLDSSNIKPWDSRVLDHSDALFSHINTVKENRSSADLFFELLLKYGLPLDAAVEERNIAGCTVYTAKAGALVACLEGRASEELAEGIVDLFRQLRPALMRVVYRDSLFTSDVIKANSVQILAQAGISDVRSI